MFLDLYFLVYLCAKLSNIRYTRQFVVAVKVIIKFIYDDNTVQFNTYEL